MRTLQQTGLKQLAIGALLGSLAAFCLLEPSANPRAAAQSADIPNRESTAQEELDLIRGKLPDQAHAIMDVGYQFSNLWFAAKAENWPLADVYFKESKSHLNWAMRSFPCARTMRAKRSILRQFCRRWRTRL